MSSSIASSLPVRLRLRVRTVLLVAGAALLLSACSTPARNDGLPDRGGFEYKRRILSF